MNWDAIGAIGQVLGSVAVFVTLGYLAIQVRHASNEARRALSQDREGALREQFIQDMDERNLRIALKANAALGVDVRDRPFLSALMDQAGLTAEEANVMYIRQLSTWSLRRQSIRNVRDFTAAEQSDLDRGIRASYGQPGMGRMFFETFIKPTQHPYTVRYIDNLLAQPG